MYLYDFNHILLKYFTGKYPYCLLQTRANRLSDSSKYETVLDICYPYNTIKIDYLIMYMKLIVT